METNDSILITAFGAITPIGSDYGQIKTALQNGISGIHRNNKYNCTNFITKHAGIPKEGNASIKWASKNKTIIGEHFYATLAAQKLKQHPNFPDNFYLQKQIGCIVGVDEPLLNMQTYVDMFSHKSPCKYNLLNNIVHNMKLQDYLDYELSSVLNTIHKEIPFSGYSLSNAGLCAASLQAMGVAYNAIRLGHIDAAIVGGVSGKVNPINMARLELMRAISLDMSLPPEKRSRPFDRRRSGFILAEGGILFLLEKQSNVAKRGKQGLLEILGYGSSLGAQHIVIPHTDSLEMELCMKRAIKDSGVSLKEINLINAHGTSTVLNDLHEAQAINKVFGSYAQDIKITANKSIHGHLIAAAGAMEVLNTLISINEYFTPGTINLDSQDSNCNVNVVSETIDSKVSVVLKNSFGMGGLAASMVLSRVENG